MPQQEDKVMLKKDTCGGGRRAGVTATMKRAVKPWTPFRSRRPVRRATGGLGVRRPRSGGHPRESRRAGRRGTDVSGALCHVSRARRQRRHGHRQECGDP